MLPVELIGRLLLAVVSTVLVFGILWLKKAENTPQNED